MAADQPPSLDGVCVSSTHELAQEFARLPAWMTLVVDPSRSHRELRIKVRQDVGAIAAALKGYDLGRHRFSAARFADASVVICIVPADAPPNEESATREAKGK